MANRMEGNTYIIDSSNGNIAIPWNQGARVRAVSLWGANSSAEVIFTGPDTTNVVVRLTHPSAGNSAQSIAIYLDISFDNMKVPTLTAGTAWIYFS